jgi:hypothetical protein
LEDRSAVSDFNLRNQPPLPEHERPEQPSRLSQTFLRHTANCFRSGAFYLQFGGGAGSHEMDRGTAGHRVAERMGKHALEYGEPTVPHELVREIVNEVIAEPDILISPDEIDFLHVLGYHFAEALVFDPEAIVGLERKVVLEIGGWRIVGKIDLAWAKGDRAGVWDYKTSMNLPDIAAWGPGETDAGKKRIRRFLFQTLLYALLLKYGRPVSTCPRCHGSGEIGWNDSPIKDPQCAQEATCDVCHGDGEIVEDTPLAPRAQYLDLAEVYPAYLYEDENGAKTLASRRTTITLDELENHRRWLEALIGKIGRSFETGEWPAVPGSHCNECPAQRLCPIPAVLRDRGFDPDTGEVIVVDSNESARAALALRDRLNAEAGALWEQAKAWADQGNVIVVGDQVYEFKYVETTSVRKSRGKNDWDGLVAAIEYAADTGEPFDREKWIKKGNGTRFQKRPLRPDEKTPDYPEEVEHGHPHQEGRDQPERAARVAAGRADAGPEPEQPAEPGARFGDDAPF